MTFQKTIVYFYVKRNRSVSREKFDPKLKDGPKEMARNGEKLRLGND